MIKITGDFGKLHQLAVDLVQKERSLKNAWHDCTGAATQALQDQFRAGAPIGGRWKKNKNGSRIMNQTATMMYGTYATNNYPDMVMESHVDYAGVHQSGATIRSKRSDRPMAFRWGGRDWFAHKVRLPKRRVVPESMTQIKRGGLFGKWLKIIEKALHIG